MIRNLSTKLPDCTGCQQCSLSLHIELLPTKKPSEDEHMQYRQVAFVADEHDGHVGVCVLSRILQPAGQVIECFPPACQTPLSTAHTPNAIPLLTERHASPAQRAIPAYSFDSIAYAKMPRGIPDDPNNSQTRKSCHVIQIRNLVYQQTLLMGP
jgi:hypothetical protein